MSKAAISNKNKKNEHGYRCTQLQACQVSENYTYLQVLMFNTFNPFNPEFTIVIFTQYKPRIAAAILDL